MACPNMEMKKEKASFDINKANTKEIFTFFTGDKRWAHVMDELTATTLTAGVILQRHNGKKIISAEDLNDDKLDSEVFTFIQEVLSPRIKYA